MCENGTLHAFRKMGDGPSTICLHRKAMQIGRKSLEPATDQGSPLHLITTEEVAVGLQMAPKTFRNWRSAGLGPP